ncbi:MAG: T9SS type A sorting domain-containing protein [Saprospiraceae bacterium]|nr:T9SS type A sorting domain-containing protein [Saprospiraceae bacterium]
MKSSFLYFIFLGGLSIFFLQSNSGGRAAAGNADSTGSPVNNNQTCNTCHSAGNFGTTSSEIQILDNGTPVTEYTAGQTYTLQVTVTNATGNPIRYASQTVALLSDDTQAGSLSSATTTNTQISTLSNRQYLEHGGSGMNSDGIFSATWTAPAAGSGTVTFYSVGMASNGNSGTSGDNVSPSSNLQLPEAVASSVAEVEVNTIQLKSFPNPTQGVVTVELQARSSAEYNIQVVDFLGKVLENRFLEVHQGHNNIQLDLSNYPAGMYFIYANGEDQNQAIPVSKQ